jgi:hypothetical protein
MAGILLQLATEAMEPWGVQMSKHGMTSQQASQKKKQGHKREREFNKIYGDPDASINHSGASADCEISEGHEILKALQETIGTNSREVSLKGGNTIQIHLGNLPELTDEANYTISKNSKGHTCVEHGIPFSQQVESFRQKDFWDKYLKKGDILAYSYDDAGDGSHIFFNMDDVNDFIINECKWRRLDTGRLKGDIQGKQYLTYEYRSKKGSFVLGASGSNKGKQFIDLLQRNLRHVIA